MRAFALIAFAMRAKALIASIRAKDAAQTDQTGVMCYYQSLFTLPNAA